MKKIIFVMINLILSFVSATAVADKKHIMSTDELLVLSEKNSEAITASQFNELVAQTEIDVAEANYYPILNAEAIDSTGFPGSSAGTGPTGLVGSPYRSGAAAGLVAEQLVLDFGRTAADIRASKAGVEVAKQSTRITAYEVKVLALEIFYQCARYQRQKNIWAELTKESQIITKEAIHFVNTGQRSIVDKYLSDSQTEEARTAYAFFSQRVNGAMNQLAIITGLEADSFSCPSLSDALLDSLDPKSNIYASPYISRAEASAKVAHEQLERKKADLWPKVFAVASAGEMQNTHLVPKEHYSAGIGIVIPLFDQKTNTRINQAQSELLLKQQEIDTQIQTLNEMNARYDAIINSSTVRLEHLKTEVKIAREGFRVAKRRYFSEEAELVDLREAWRNLARAQTTIEDVRAELLIARGAKALLNGGA